MHTDDTIAAIASAAGGALRGIVPISGPETIACLRACFVASESDPAQAPDGLSSDNPAARVIGGVLQLEQGRCLPCELYLWPGNRSYTREPLAELHTIGSPPLLDLALRALCRQGVRLAEPGEFTLRAFLAGRLDLTQAEAVLGVIDAQGEDELATALAQLAGGISRPLTQIRDTLLNLLADVEAGLDFVEEDIHFISPTELEHQLTAAAGTLRELTAQMEARSENRELPRVVLIGPPNAGKSSLFNALALRYGRVGEGSGHSQSRAALVSPEPGTTRDYLTVELTLAGRICELVDTAGIEGANAGDATCGAIAPCELVGPSESPSESIAGAAQAMTASQQERADLRILCLDATRALSDWEQTELRRSNTPQKESATPQLAVWTKSDVAAIAIQNSPGVEGAVIIRTSSRTGEGLDALARAMTAMLKLNDSAESATVSATANRCRASLAAAEAAIETARGLVTGVAGDELLAIELRSAIDELGKVVGAIYTDDLLDRIFSRFCIGK